ncbi:MAG: hypothetical protein FJW32_15135 [Acidobacteria bacterium]|nr:hypothetical protein [Acidobacteriota bacterium]
MPETLEKLRPDRDLQVYFERPSAIAAMSGASPTGFTASGTWRQQFDWCVIEWNRDNVFEHPLFRSLPDGDLSGLTLTYEETRDNCIPMDSDLYPTVDWPYLRLWVDAAGVETFHQVPLANYAVPIVGSYIPATASFELKGSITVGDYVGLAWLSEHYTHECIAGDTLSTVAAAIAGYVNTFSTNMTAASSGAVVTLTYTGALGANGNKVGAYGQVDGARTEYWDVWHKTFSGGVSPSKWRVTLPFNALVDRNTVTVPTNKVRKMRWTYAAAMQTGAYQRSEFEAVVSNWTVTGTNRAYRVAGPGSRRIEDNAKKASYYGSNWAATKGNFSGGTIRWTGTYGDSVTIPYRCPQNHELYLGTRLLTAGADIALRVDNETPRVISLRANGEDTLMRVPLGAYGPGEHTVLISHNGPSGNAFYFDFLEVAIPATTVSNQVIEPKVTLATDWDTDHSLAVPAERTAWMIYSLGFHGRVNHYVGALIFYEMYRQGHVYASAHIDFAGTPTPSASTTITIGSAANPGAALNVTHLNLFGDTAETIAKAFELEFNRGYTGIRAEATGTRLTIFARAMGLIGEDITIAATPASGAFSATRSAANLTGAVNGEWRTDLTANPRINRACRDWSRKFYDACKAYGLDMTAAFSLELQHGDPSEAAGIAQRYSNGDPCLLNTPALQTNFSPASIAYWKKVHLEMADILAAAGYVPYLQFGEVQWWYFPNMLPGMTPISMPYYDQYTKDQFQAAHGFPLRFIGNNTVAPAAFPEEGAFLPSLIGAFTDAIRAHVLATHPNCRFEVLYPTDVNDTAWGHVVNYPDAAWTPEKLDCLKTESFSFTFARDLNKSKYSIEYPASKGFAKTKAAFLVGPGDSSTTWQKEARMAKARNVESTVLFALDQFCLIGYPVPFWRGLRKGRRLG